MIHRHRNVLSRRAGAFFIIPTFHLHIMHQTSASFLGTTTVPSSVMLPHVVHKHNLRANRLLFSVRVYRDGKSSQRRFECHAQMYAPVRHLPWTSELHKFPTKCCATNQTYFISRTNKKNRTVPFRLHFFIQTRNRFSKGWIEIEAFLSSWTQKRTPSATRGEENSFQPSYIYVVLHIHACCGEYQRLGITKKKVISTPLHVLVVIMMKIASWPWRAASLNQRNSTTSYKCVPHLLFRVRASLVFLWLTSWVGW